MESKDYSKERENIDGGTEHIKRRCALNIDEKRKKGKLEKLLMRILTWFISRRNKFVGERLPDGSTMKKLNFGDWLCIKCW